MKCSATLSYPHSQTPARRGNRRQALIGISSSVALLLSLVHALPSAGQQPQTNKPVINYREPMRDYEIVRRGRLVIHIEKQFAMDSPAMAQQAISRLAKNIGLALSALPAHARPQLGNVPFYLMYGPKAAAGGRGNGLEFFQKNAPERHPQLDRNWGSSIVVYSAENYLQLSDFWALKAVVHEMAHAYQLENWGEKQPDILNAWEQAMKKGLYRQVRDKQNQFQATAYASVNQLEYFAELSCMYFVGCNYQPFNRRELQLYDPEGFAMIRKMWAREQLSTRN